MAYIDTWSLWLDVRILFQTIPAVLKGAGASKTLAVYEVLHVPCPILICFASSSAFGGTLLKRSDPNLLTRLFPMPLAGQRQVFNSVRAVDGTRYGIHRPLVALAGSQNPCQDRSGGPRWRRRHLEDNVPLGVLRAFVVQIGILLFYSQGTQSCNVTCQGWPRYSMRASSIALHASIDPAQRSSIVRRSLRPVRLRRAPCADLPHIFLSLVDAAHKRAYVVRVCHDILEVLP